MFNTLIFLDFLSREQPPPRGCVLKLVVNGKNTAPAYAAASARLCVETSSIGWVEANNGAAASARLCVETAIICSWLSIAVQPPPRGCVLKPWEGVERLFY